VKWDFTVIPAPVIECQVSERPVIREVTLSRRKHDGSLVRRGVPQNCKSGDMPTHELPYCRLEHLRLHRAEAVRRICHAWPDEPPAVGWVL
jgi:hypothetical protein